MQTRRIFLRLILFRFSSVQFYRFVPFLEVKGCVMITHRKTTKRHLPWPMYVESASAFLV